MRAPLTAPDATTQAGRVILAFGGVPALAAAIDADRSTVYRWLHPVAKGGTAGRIPNFRLKRIAAAAKRLKVAVDAADLAPAVIIKVPSL